MSDPDGPEEWWRAPTQRPDSLTDAAADLRHAADYLRDAATPAAPPKQSNWDWSWLKNWVRYSEHGKSFKRAAYSSAPAIGFVLWDYHHQTGHGGGGAAAVFFGLAGIANLMRRNPFTRWLMWGAILGPVYYPPALVNLIFGTVAVLFGGK